MRSSLNRFNKGTVLWTALHLAATDRRILVSLAQQPEQTMGWYAKSFWLSGLAGFAGFYAAQARAVSCSPRPGRSASILAGWILMR